MLFQYPGGIAEISRGSSEATTPGLGTMKVRPRRGLRTSCRTSQGRRGTAATPTGVRVILKLTGGGRSARPPATVFHPSGMKTWHPKPTLS